MRRRPEHAAPRSRSVPVRVVLALGVLSIGGIGGTLAAWTVQATVGGTSLTGGTIDLLVNDADSLVTSTLTMATMVPGSSSAQVITVKDGGDVPMKYSVQAGLTGADASAYSGAGALKLTLVAGGTRSGSGSSATCTGGSVLASAVSLTTTTSSELVPRRGPVSPGATETVCVQVALDLSAPSSLQAKVASLSLTFVGSSDLS